MEKFTITEKVGINRELTVNVWQCESTEEAYDICQWNDEVKNGDILWVPSEGVVGLADTWPYALTEEHGALHRVDDGKILNVMHRCEQSHYKFHRERLDLSDHGKIAAKRAYGEQYPLRQDVLQSSMCAWL